MRKWLTVWLVLAGSILGVSAQTFRADVRQVYLPVWVFKNKQTVRGLTLRNFRIWEETKNSEGKTEEIEQEINDSVSYRNLRLALATTVDASGSMGTKSPVTGESRLEEAKTACVTLFETIFRAGQDQGLVSEFAFESWYVVDSISGLTVRVSNRFYINQNWTNDLEEVKRGVGKIEIPVGPTPLRDAIFILANLFEKTDPSALRVAVVLTDGEDDQGNVNEKTLAEVMVELQRQQVLVFAVGLYANPGKKDILREVAAATGGEAFFEPDPSQLTATFLMVGERIRDVYFVSYVAKSTIAGPRKIRVEVGEWDEKGKWHKNKVQPRHRQGYYSQP